MFGTLEAIWSSLEAVHNLPCFCRSFSLLSMFIVIQHDTWTLSQQQEVANQYIRFEWAKWADVKYPNKLNKPNERKRPNPNIPGYHLFQKSQSYQNYKRLILGLSKSLKFLYLKGDSVFTVINETKVVERTTLIYDNTINTWLGYLK